MLWIICTCTRIPCLLSPPPTPCTDRTCIPCIGRWFLYHWATRKDPRSFFKFVDSKDSEAAWAGKGFFQPSCVTKFPNQGLNPNPLQQKHRVLTTGLPEKSWQRIYHQSLESHFFSFLQVRPKVVSPEKGRLIMPFILLLRGTLSNPLHWKERKKKKERKWDDCWFQTGLATATPWSYRFRSSHIQEIFTVDQHITKVSPWGERSEYHQKPSYRLFYSVKSICLFMAALGLSGSVASLWLWRVGASLRCGLRAPHCRGSSSFLGVPALGCSLGQQQLWLLGFGGSAACGTFPHQGSNPGSLHWQVDSYPPRRQGSPNYTFSAQTRELIWVSIADSLPWTWTMRKAIGGHDRTQTARARFLPWAGSLLTSGFSLSEMHLCPPLDFGVGGAARSWNYIVLSLDLCSPRHLHSQLPKAGHIAFLQPPLTLEGAACSSGRAGRSVACCFPLFLCLPEASAPDKSSQVGEV